MEGDALAEVEDEGLRVDDLPPFGEVRLDVHVGVVLGQSVPHEREEIALVEEGLLVRVETREILGGAEGDGTAGGRLVAGAVAASGPRSSEGGLGAGETGQSQTGAGGALEQ